MVRRIFWQKSKEPDKESENEAETETETGTKSTTVPQIKNGSRRRTPLFDVNWILTSKKKVPTRDAAVGDGIVDEALRKNNFLAYFGICRKSNDRRKDSVKSNLIGKFVKGIHREATIAQREVISSSIASVIAAGISHPLEVIKAQYQLVRQPRTTPLPFKRRQKLFYVLKHIYVTRGFKRFFRGHIESQRISLSHGVSMFWTYQRALQILNDVSKLNDWTNFKIFLAGFASATIPVMLLRPLAAYRERQQNKNNVLIKHGRICAAHQLGKFDRRRPLFRGTFSLFMHLGTQCGLRFLFYFNIRDHLTELKSTNDKATSTNPLVAEVESIIHLSNFELLFAGALSSILGDIIVHPLDVLNTRLNMGPLLRQQYRFNETCRRYGQCFGLILRKESIRAFYAGLLPSLLKSAINTAVQFAVYEKTRHWVQPLFF